MEYIDKFIKPKGHLQMKLFKGKYDYKTDTINGEILNEFDEHNIIVNTASEFMASLIAHKDIVRIATGEEGVIYDGDQIIGYNYNGSYDPDDTGKYPIGGIKYLGLGNGLLPTFQTQAQQGEYIMTADQTMQIAEQEKLKQLQHEVFRKQIDYWCFLNSTGQISQTPTGQVRFTTLIPYSSIVDSFGETPKFIVEMGMFCGDGNPITEYDTSGKQINPGLMFNYRLFKGWSMIENSELLVHWTISFGQ